jgi:hypothetical protein
LKVKLKISQADVKYWYGQIESNEISIVGNRFVQRVIARHAIQTKLRIGQPGDIYEQEADRVAEQVMQMSDLQVWRQEEEEPQPKELPGQTSKAAGNLDAECVGCMRNRV